MKVICFYLQTSLLEVIGQHNGSHYLNSIIMSNDLLSR